MSTFIDVTIPIDREAALIHGSSEFGDMKISIDLSDLSAEQRQALTYFRYNEDRQVYNLGDPEPINCICYSIKLKQPLGVVPELAEERLEIVAEYLEGAIQKHNESKEEEAKQLKHEVESSLKDLEDWLNKADADLIYERNPMGIASGFALILEDSVGDREVNSQSYYYDVSKPYHLDDARELSATPEGRSLTALVEQVNKRLEKLKIQAHEKTEASKRQTEESHEKKVAKLEEEIAAKQKVLDDWVEQFGDVSQKERHAENLLPEEEILAGLRKIAFAPLDEFERFKRIKKEDVCSCRDEYHSEISFETRELEGATKAQFAALKAVRKALKKTSPDAVAELRLHEAVSHCYGECGKVRVTTIHVTIPFRGYEFTREFVAKIHEA